VDVHRDDPAFGYRFIADELAAPGVIAGENKVARSYSQQRIWSAFSKYFLHRSGVRRCHLFRAQAGVRCAEGAVRFGSRDGSAATR
jgi:hypothetical protein